MALYVCNSTVISYRAAPPKLLSFVLLWTGRQLYKYNKLEIHILRVQLILRDHLIFGYVIGSKSLRLSDAYMRQ